MTKLKKNNRVKQYPTLALVLAIDALDVLNLFTTPLIAVFGTGLALDVLIDFGQLLLVNHFFDNPWLLIAGTAELLLLPPPFDAFPTFTVTYILMEKV